MLLFTEKEAGLKKKGRFSGKKKISFLTALNQQLETQRKDFKLQKDNSERTERDKD